MPLTNDAADALFTTLSEDAQQAALEAHDDAFYIEMNGGTGCTEKAAEKAAAAFIAAVARFAEGK